MSWPIYRTHEDHSGLGIFQLQALINHVIKEAAVQCSYIAELQLHAREMERVRRLEAHKRCKIVTG